MGLDCHSDDPSFISWTSGDGEKSSWLDYAVVSGCLQVDRFRVIDDVSVLSDHWPIEMFLAVDILAPTGGSSVPIVGRLDWNRCSDYCIKIFQECNNYPSELKLSTFSTSSDRSLACPCVDAFRDRSDDSVDVWTKR